MDGICAVELHTTVQRNFKTLHAKLSIIIYGVADFVETIPYGKKNQGFKYKMTMINSLTKLMTALPPKTKSALNVSLTLEPVLGEKTDETLPDLLRKEGFSLLT